MKLIIAGSRDVTKSVKELDGLLVKAGYRVEDITEVVSGGARGMDSSGELWACSHEIPIKRFIPDWTKYRKSAGHRRNREMGDYADAALVVHNGSPGSAGMITYMKQIKKPVVDVDVRMNPYF